MSFFRHKRVNRITNYLFIPLIIFLIVLFVIGWVAHKPVPEGKEGPEAEQVATNMMKALNYEAYESIEQISWFFPGGREYDWFKSKNTVTVKWDEHEATFDTRTKNGSVKINGEDIEGEKSKNIINKAWEYFANDSFWFVAPYKIFDPGTSRKLVEVEDGSYGLLITYSSGGVTPGDSYLWILDDNYLPIKWKMWVSIIPIGGLGFTWEDWVSRKDALFSQKRVGPGGFVLQIRNLEVK